MNEGSSETIGERVKNFLSERFQEDDSIEMAFKKGEEQHGIPYPTITKLIDATGDPKLETILKIASYFDCSIDEIIGKKEYVPNQNTTFTKISVDDLADNLRGYIKNKLLENPELTPYTLGETITNKPGSVIVYNFLNTDGNNKNKRMLGSKYVKKLADYFEEPLDVLINRIPISKQTKGVEIESKKTQVPKSNPLQDLSNEDALALEQIKKEYQEKSANDKRKITKDKSDTTRYAPYDKSSGRTFRK